MKKVLLTINIILIAAVAWLFYLQYGKNTTSSAAGSVVYINSDSLNDNYEYLKKAKKDLEDKQAAMQQELGEKRTSLQQEIVNFQQRAQSGAMSASSIRATEKTLREKEQRYLLFEDSLSKDLQATQIKMNDDLYKNVLDYIEEINTDGQYKYVFFHSKAGQILYADDALNITEQVLKGINEKYKNPSSDTKKGSEEEK